MKRLQALSCVASFSSQRVRQGFHSTASLRGGGHKQGVCVCSSGWLTKGEIPSHSLYSASSRRSCVPCLCLLLFKIRVEVHAILSSLPTAFSLNCFLSPSLSLSLFFIILIISLFIHFSFRSDPISQLMTYTQSRGSNVTQRRKKLPALQRASRGKLDHMLKAADSFLEKDPGFTRWPLSCMPAGMDILGRVATKHSYWENR